MADNKTYLFYDKAVDDNHMYENKLTINVTMEVIFSSNYKCIEGPQAVKEFNKCFDKHYSIADNLDFNLYNVFLFTYEETGAKIRITVIEINNDKLKEYVEKNKPIPNEKFLCDLCKYHTLYEKATNKIDILDRKYAERKIAECTKNITTTAMTPNADITDPIEQQPEFTLIPLYDYQKRTIKWMLNRERNRESIYYNKNDEIVLGDVVYDATKDVKFILGTNRDKLVFKGGALIDEVGLGKTYQMITVALSNPAKNINYIQDKYNKLFSKATLVLCPNQLVGQWTREIEKVIKKSYGTSVVSYFTKNHHDKYTYQDLLDADFVMVSYNFLSNDCFLNPWVSKLSSQKSYLTSMRYCKADCEKLLNNMGLEMKKKISSLQEVCANPLLIHWHRLVVDEIHEVYTNPKMKHVGKILELFQSDYKWCLTATPFDKTDECLLNMVKYVTDTFDTTDNHVFKDKIIGEYLNKKFFRRNTKKSVVSEYKLPPLKEKLIWLNFSKTEWMMYNAYMANPNVDKFGVLIRQICCHPKLAEEIKIVASNCKSLEDIEKVMVKHYESQMKLAATRVSYLDYRIKKVQKRIKILELKRQRFLIRKLGYNVKVDFANKPILSKQEVELLESQLADDPSFAGLMIGDSVDEKNPFDDDESSDSEDDKAKGKKKQKPLFIISEDNQDVVKSMISAKDLNDIPDTILTQMDIEKNFKERLTVATTDYKGKKATYDYYADVMSKLKTISENKKLDNPNEDSDSDSDDEGESKQKCAVCMGSITGHDSGVTKCGHIFCYNCVKPHVEKTGKCPTCQKATKSNEILQLEVKLPETKEEAKEFKDKQELISKVGTKLANLIFFLKNSNEHSIIFSQWDDLLRKVGDVLDEYGIKNVFCKGNVWQRDKAIREFNAKDDIKVIMLSSESAASGTNLTKAKNVILLDPVHGTYEYMRNTEWQAIGRAYRMGQTQEVNVVRFIIKNTVEEQIYNMNKDQHAKSPVETIKFEMNDDEINLDAEKIGEILDASKKSVDKKPKVGAKPKKTSKKEVEKIEDLIVSGDDYSDGDY